MPVVSPAAAPSNKTDPRKGAVVGDRLGADGRYELRSRIGTGGMGAVFAAHDHKLGCERAVKVLDPRFCTVATFVQRFRREAMATSRISHPNIVSVVDVSEEDERPIYLVMELLDGQPLSRIVRGSGRLPWTRVHSYIDQIAAGLGAAHGHGVVHRDVKPGNCVVLGDGTVKVLDFGIAKITDASSEGPALTAVGEIIGTCSYMAPEQIHGQVDQRSDVYALGALMFRLLTGRLPFTGSDYHEVLDGHLHHAPPRPSEFADELPEGVDDLVLTMLAKKPANRFQTMDAVRGALAELAPKPTLQRGAHASGEVEAVDDNPTSVGVGDEPAAAPPGASSSRRRPRVTVRAGSGAMVDDALASVSAADEFWEDERDPTLADPDDCADDGAAEPAVQPAPTPVTAPGHAPTPLVAATAAKPGRIGKTETFAVPPMAAAAEEARGRTVLANDLPAPGVVVRAPAPRPLPAHPLGTQASPEPSGGGAGKWIALVVVLLLAVGGGIWMATQAADDAAAASKEPGTAPPPQQDPPSAVEHAPTPSEHAPTPSVQPVPAAAPGASPSAPAPEPAPPQPDTTPTEETPVVAPEATPDPEPKTATPPAEAPKKRRKGSRPKSSSVEPPSEPAAPPPEPKPAEPADPPAPEPKIEEPGDLRDPFG